MTKTEFEEFKKTGEQHNTSNTWQNSARDSKITSLNSKYEKQVGNITYKPRLYYTHWEHFHPVTGLINDATNNNIFGTDLEFDYSHKLFSKDANLIGGLTLKLDKSDDAKKYEYKDVVTNAGRIVKTLSNEKGALALSEDSSTFLYGAYLMESFKATDKWKFDVSTRIDKLNFDINGNELRAYNYGAGRYILGRGNYSLDNSFTLFSAKIGTSYALTDTSNIYTSVASANQAPTTSELGNNNDLNKSQSINYEVGLKTRTEKSDTDIALFQNFVKDEIILTQQIGSQSVYDNAGQTDKKGVEFNTSYDLTNNVKVGGAYTYSKFRFDTFNESVRISNVPTLISRDGNYLPFIPENQYSIFAAYNLENGFKTRVTARTYGSYYMDNANTQKYEGYDLITDYMIGYEKQNHNIQLNINNLFDKYYAIEASKDTSGIESYKAGTPRSTMLTYTYKF